MNKERSMLKFILYRIRQLITNGQGSPRFIDDFDDIIYDIFGAKNFARHLVQCRSDRDIVMVLSEVGYENIVRLLDSKKMFNEMQSLIILHSQIDTLRKRQKKLSKKGKKVDKAIIKEYKWEVKLYKDAIDMFRKTFGIKNSKSHYKRMFGNLVEFARQDEDDDNYSIVMDMDRYFSDDDDDDDIDEDSEFARMYGKPKSKARKSSKTKRALSLEDEYDFVIEDDDDEEDDDEDSEKMNDRIDELESMISSLSDHMQVLINATQSAPRVNPGYVQTQPMYKTMPAVNPVPPVPVVTPEGTMVGSNADMEYIKKCLSTLANKLNKVENGYDEMSERQAEIIDFLQAISEDPEEPDENEEVRNALNKYEDFYDDDVEPVSKPKPSPATLRQTLEPAQFTKNQENMTVEDLINVVNSSEPNTVDFHAGRFESSKVKNEPSNTEITEKVTITTEISQTTTDSEDVVDEE